MKAKKNEIKKGNEIGFTSPEDIEMRFKREYSITQYVMEYDDSGNLFFEEGEIPVKAIHLNDDKPKRIEELNITLENLDKLLMNFK